MYYILLFVVIIILLNYNYKEGLTNEETIREVLINNGTTNTNQIISDLKTRQICEVPTVSTTTIGTGGLIPTLDKEQLKELSMKDYKLKIESGINFHDKLSDLEKKVFMLYYEDKWEDEYNKMLKKRDDFILQDNKTQCDSQLSNFIKNYLKKYPNKGLKHLLNDNSETTIENAIHLLSYLEDLEEYNINNKKIVLDDINEREIYYRNKEEYKIEKINKWMNNIYIILYFCLLVVLFYKNKLNIYQNYYIYIILLLIPTFIYPFIFNIIKLIVHKTYIYFKDQTPKNAFMD